MKIKRADRRTARLVKDVAEYLGDLRMAGGDRNLASSARQGPCRRQEAGGLALAKAAIIDKLDFEAAMRGRRLKHAGLDALRDIPGRLPAHRRVEGENQAAAARRRRAQAWCAAARK